MCWIIKSGRKCYSCRQSEHLKYECESRHTSRLPNTRTRWCVICKRSNRETNYCRCRNRQDETKMSKENDDNYYFAFAMKVNRQTPPNSNSGLILVDCGATTHIVNDSTRFETFTENFDPSSHKWNPQ